MSGWLRTAGLAVLCAVLGVIDSFAATSSRMDILSDDVAGSPAASVDVGAVKPIVRPAPAADRPAPRGNPLWSVPLSALTGTQERPIFSATRRPPPRAVAAAPVEEAPPPPAPKPLEGPPPLMLVGAVVGEGDAIAILIKRTDQKVVRLRQGESLDGWSLASIQPREVTFKQGDRSEVLALQRPEATPSAPPSAPGLAILNGGSQLVTPTPGGPSFAPFVPRATPKNGLPDGL
ncbi:hypothetical protein JQ594_23440 [Bradyrhizobium manausense]|nr:hypothetical protein [Bradyrhizobium manausense]MBR0688898.1 hypothetical protein [Bradyrhizobium manausense]